MAAKDFKTIEAMQADHKERVHNLILRVGEYIGEVAKLRGKERWSGLTDTERDHLRVFERELAEAEAQLAILQEIWAHWYCE